MLHNPTPSNLFEIIFGNPNTKSDCHVTAHNADVMFFYCATTGKLGYWGEQKIILRVPGSLSECLPPSQSYHLTGKSAMDVELASKEPNL